MEKFILEKQNILLKKDLKNIVKMPLKKEMKKDLYMPQCENMGLKIFK